MHSLDLIGHDNLDQVFQESNSMMIKEIVKPIEKAMELFQRNISTLSYLPDVERITMRVVTLHNILDIFMHHIKDCKPEEVLEKAGESIGETFSNDLFDFLLRINKLPKDVDVLLKITNEFDTIAGWGKFSSRIDKDQIFVEVKDSFITRSDTRTHKYCHLMKGYLGNFIYQAFKEHYRLFKKHVILPSRKPLTISKLNIACETDVCKFSLKMRDEELVNAYDNLYNAKFSMQEGNLKEASVFLRTSIENAFKEKIKMDVDSPTSVLKIIKAFKDNNIKLHYNAISELYGSTSAELHGSRKSNTAHLQKLYHKWSQELKKLELMKLNKEIVIKS